MWVFCSTEIWFDKSSEREETTIITNDSKDRNILQDTIILLRCYSVFTVIETKQRQGICIKSSSSIKMFLWANPQYLKCWV